MHYECEHSKKVLPRHGKALPLESCSKCPTDRAKVKYAPVYGPDEQTLEKQLAATMLFHLKHSNPMDWSEQPAEGVTLVLIPSKDDPTV